MAKLATAWVVCGNDFPECVVLESEESARRVKAKVHEKRKSICPEDRHDGLITHIKKVYVDDVDLDTVLLPASDAQRCDKTEKYRECFGVAKAAYSEKKQNALCVDWIASLLWDAARFFYDRGRRDEEAEWEASSSGFEERDSH